METALHNAVYSVYTVHDAVTDVMIECTCTIIQLLPIDIARAERHSDTVRLLERGNK